MKRICAWCRKDQGEVEFVDLSNPVTHGVCSDCAEEVLSFEAEPMSSYLDKFSGSVYMINSECEIISANKEGAETLGKDLAEFAGEVAGGAFECKFANREGGCGESEHCRSCTIRNSIIGTYETGKSILKVPAYPDFHEVAGEAAIKYLISTEKVGKAVIVKVEKMV